MPPFRHTMPVRFADVDHAGIVYYPRFFHYFHVTLEELLREKLGPRAYVALMDVERIGFPAVQASCDYKAPLRFGDTVDIDLSVARLGARSITFRYRVYRREDDQAARVLAAEGQTISAIVNLDEFRATTVTDTLRAVFEPLVEAVTAPA